jgi:hypothetical protein
MSDHRDGDGLESAELVRVAAEAGYRVSIRMLESFRAESLLPRPVRTGYRGRVPVWTYPSWARQQLLALLSWRDRTKDPRALRMLLWLEGLPIPTETVRESIVDGLRDQLEELEQEIAAYAQRHGLDPDDRAGRPRAVRLLSSEFAAKRGPTALPRHGRVRAVDRARVLELVLRALTDGSQVRATGGHAAAGDTAVLKRVLGCAPSEPWRTRAGLPDPGEMFLDAVDALAFPNLLQAVRDAQEADLEKARQLITSLFRWLPLAAPVLAVLFDDEAYAALADMRHVHEEPAILMILVPYILGVGRRESLRGAAVAFDSPHEPTVEVDQESPHPIARASGPPTQTGSGSHHAAATTSDPGDLIGDHGSDELLNATGVVPRSGRRQESTAAGRSRPSLP